MTPQVSARSIYKTDTEEEEKKEKLDICYHSAQESY